MAEITKHEKGWADKMSFIKVAEQKIRVKQFEQIQELKGSGGFWCKYDLLET